MYEIILDALIDDMQSFGIVSTIVISQDYYDSMSKKEKDHLESLLDINTGIHWAVLSDKKEYWHFRYSAEPFVFEEIDND